MIKNEAGIKVSAKIKAKLELATYLKAFDLSKHCSDFSELKKTEPTKVQEQVTKLIERMNKALVIK